MQKIDLWGLITGQTEATDFLKKAVASPVHAYLFIGPEGAGREEIMGAIAQHRSDNISSPDDMKKGDVLLAQIAERKRQAFESKKCAVAHCTDTDIETSHSIT